MKAMPKTSVATNVRIPFASIENYVNKYATAAMNKRIASAGTVASSYRNLDCCFTYVPVSGTVDVLYCDLQNDFSKLMHVMIETSYFFTCIRDEDDLYRVAWSASLN
jgi:hypothetical protein